MEIRLEEACPMPQWPGLGGGHCTCLLWPGIWFCQLPGLRTERVPGTGFRVGRVGGALSIFKSQLPLGNGER